MKRFDRKDAVSMLTAFAAITSIPLGVFLVRPRPLSAETTTELVSLARTSRQDEILSPMRRRYEGMSLKFESPDPTEDPNLRWAEIQASMEQTGADWNEVQQVTQIAQNRLSGSWPCFAERGLLQDQPVWLVVGSSPFNTGMLGWICPPSDDEVRRERIRRYCTNIQVTIVNAQPPYQVLN